MENEEETKRIQEKYSKLYKNKNYSSQGGIFTAKRRKQLLGIDRKYGRDRPLESPLDLDDKHVDANVKANAVRATFWYKVREPIRNGLIDIQLFIETSKDDESINMVLNSQNLKPIFDVFFQDWVYEDEQRNAENASSKVKVAQMLIEFGLNYLRSKSQPFLIKIVNSKIDETIELSKGLALNLLTEKEKHEAYWKEMLANFNKEKKKED
jgi:hypothetical protein